MHTWTDNDNIIAYYLYRFSRVGTTSVIAHVAECLGIPANSMSIKIANFEYLDTRGQSGLSGFSTQAEMIYNQYKNLPDSDFVAIGERLFTRKGISLSTSPPSPSTDMKELEARKRLLEQQLAELKRTLSSARR